MKTETLTREQAIALLASEQTITRTLQRELKAAHEALDICHKRIRELEICCEIKQEVNGEH